MTKFHQAFQTWLSAIDPTVPAYQAGQVPRDQGGNPVGFPFIVYNPRFGEGLTEATQPVQAFFRIRSGYNANAARSAFADAVQAAVPKEGIILRYDDGYVVLFQGGRNWISLTDDPNDSTVIGVRFALDIRFYQ